MKETASGPLGMIGSVLLVLACACGTGRRAPADDNYLDLLRSPDAVTVVTEEARSGSAVGRRLEGRGPRGGDGHPGRTSSDRASRPVGGREIHHGPLERRSPKTRKYLGDAWERSYGELEWQPLDAAREMPWYFLASDGRTTHGYGVMTQPAAMCAWRAGTEGVTLTADVRNGGAGVRLGARRLAVCTVTSRRGKPGETPFAAARAFCRDMCQAPRLPKEPVYGFNDWYCDYGKNSAESVLYYAAFVARLAPKGGNRPFMVVDDGWQATGGGTGHGGPWDRGNANFPSMSDLADGIRKAGARPGIWIHLLTAQEGQPEAWRLAHDPGILDISVPEVRGYVRETVARLRDVGLRAHQARLFRERPRRLHPGRVRSRRRHGPTPTGAGPPRRSSSTITGTSGRRPARTASSSAATPSATWPPASSRSSGSATTPAAGTGPGSATAASTPSASGRPSTTPSSPSTPTASG